MIELQNICKQYRIAKREPGLSNAFKALLKRDYTTVDALRDISFSISDGEMVGYIGPNGAGKSTTIKIMCGVLTPDSGTCSINGRIPWKDRKEHVRHIGVVFGQRSQLWWDVPVLDSFVLLRDIYGMEELIYRRNLDELTSLLNLSELLQTPTRNLSLGQRMRCEIAASLLHDPDILFLDEPTIGLDAVSKIAVRQFIQKRNREHGTTVILTTHDMQDIEALTDRVLLIGKGQILLDGKLEELKRHTSQNKLLAIEYRGHQPFLTEGIHPVKSSDGHMELLIDTSVISASEAISRLVSQTEILDLSVSGTTTEEMVASLYQEYGI